MSARNVLAIAAHPDDIEFLMAGTLVLLGEAGYGLHYMNLANGCCGSTEVDAATIAGIRQDEARQAAASIGAKFHESICNDLEIFYDQATLARVASVIRLVQPTIVLTHGPSDYMEDHMNACRLAVTAAFSRGMPNFPVQPPREAYADPVTIYHAQPYSHRDPLGQLVLPQYFVNVEPVARQKWDMLGCHQSQKQWLDESQGLDSYLQTMKDLDAELGDISGRFQAAEGWRRHLHLGFCEAEDDPLLEALGENIFMAGEES
ncbi:MAG: PIG-L family deacetylase [Pirellulaceae bacterium]